MIRRKEPDSTNKSFNFRPNIVPNYDKDLFYFWSSPNFGKKHFNFWGRPFFGLHSILQRNYIISAKVLSHAKCVWSGLQKRPPCKILQFKYWSFVACYASRKVLINSVLQSLGNSTHVPTVAAAHVLIYDQIVC